MAYASGRSVKTQRNMVVRPYIKANMMLNGPQGSQREAVKYEDEDRSDNEEEKPTVVVLKDGDLTAEEVKQLKKGDPGDDSSDKGENNEDRKPTDKELASIAKAIGHGWEILAPALGLSRPTLERIKMDHRSSTEEQVYYMLMTWKQSKADRVTLRALLTELKDDTSVTVDWDYINSKMGIDRKPTDKELAIIAKGIGHGWEILALALGLSLPELERIKQDHIYSTVVQVYYMLQTWKQKSEADRATLWALLKDTPFTVDWVHIKNKLGIDDDEPAVNGKITSKKPIKRKIKTKSDLQSSTCKKSKADKVKKKIIG